MKFFITLMTILLLTACTHTTISPLKSTRNNHLIINLDDELKILNARGEVRSDSKVINDPIYIGDNDEVSFRGKVIENNSPLTITIGNNQPITFTGKRYTLKTIELNQGDIIQMKDKNGRIFLQVETIF